MIARFLYIIVLNALVSANVPDSGENVDLVQTNIGQRPSSSLVQGKDDVAKKATQEDEEGYDYGEQPMAEPLHQHRGKGKGKGKGRNSGSHGDSDRQDLLKVAGKTRTAKAMEIAREGKMEAEKAGKDAGEAETKHHSRAAGKGKGKGKRRASPTSIYSEDDMLKNSRLKEDVSNLEADIFKSADHPENYDEFMDHDKIWDIQPSLAQGKAKETSGEDKAKSVVRDMARSKDVRSVVRDMERSEGHISPWEIAAGRSKSKAGQANDATMMRLSPGQKEDVQKKFQDRRWEAIGKFKGKPQPHKYEGGTDMSENPKLKDVVSSMEDSVINQATALSPQGEDWDAWRDQGHDVYEAQ